MSHELILVGTSHRIADVARRERLAAACLDARAWLARSKQFESLVETLVVATCHRCEFYAVTRDVGAAARDIVQLVRDAGRGDLLGPDASRYVLHGEVALRHLCRVAAGLDSLVIGEAEIAGQIRRAAVLARAEKTSQVFLQRVMAGVLRASGRVRSETKLSSGTMSTATAGVSLIEHATGSLSTKTVLVIGAGEIGRQAASRLRKRRTGQILVCSRSAKHAGEVAAKTGAVVVPLTEIPQILSTVDAVIAAAHSPTPLVTTSTLEGRDPRRPLIVVDLSMPRVVDPDVATREGMTLKSVDDLGEIVHASLARRAREVPQAELIVQREASLAYEQFRTRRSRQSA